MPRALNFHKIPGYLDVGIGTSTPTDKLTVVGNIKIASATGYLAFADGSQQYTASPWYASPPGTPLTATMFGTVGIGTSMPEACAHIHHEGTESAAAGGANLAVSEFSGAGDCIAAGATFVELEADCETDAYLKWGPLADLAFQQAGGIGELGTDHMRLTSLGFASIGSKYPITTLHVTRKDVLVDGADLLQDDVIVEDTDAVLGLYSDDSGSFGSGISLGEIEGTELSDKWTMHRHTNAVGSRLRFTYGPDALYTNDTIVTSQDTSGNLFVGLNDNIKLSPTDDGSGPSVIQLRSSSGQTRVELRSGQQFGPAAGEVSLYNASGEAKIVLYADFDGTGDSRMVTDELEIKGGSDLSEQFDVDAADSAVVPGMVVSIDPARPGKLTVSNTPYDRKVAGVVSGAGGVSTGMTMGQSGSIADGDYPVALTGRVYCLCDASSDAIEPGDRLTTSAQPGHAMKATDHARAQGAIIGKAMTPLAAGERGLVLVLINLQ